MPTTVVVFSDNRDDLAGAANAAGLRVRRVETDDTGVAAGVAFEVVRRSGGVVLFSPASATPARQGNYADRSRSLKTPTERPSRAAALLAV